MSRYYRRSYSSLNLSKKALAAAAVAVPDLKEVDFCFSEHVSVPVYALSAKGLQTLIAFYKKEGDADSERQANAFLRVMSAPDKEKIGRLRQLEPAIRAVVSKTKSRWLYERDDPKRPTPYLVTDVTYHEATENSPASVKVAMVCFSRNKVRSERMHFDSGDLKGTKTVAELLMEKGYFLQNDLLDAAFAVSLKKYEAWWDLTGVQFRASGATYGDYKREEVILGQGGSGEKVVADHDQSRKAEERDRGEEPGFLSVYGSWGKGRDNDEEAEEEDYFPLPVHPMLYCFHLAMHCYFWIHVNGLTRYEYNPALRDKLILPEDHRDLVDVLTTESAVLREDIIEGKAGGTTILCQGDPGTGKTLTAEVYSEVVGKPLYKLHSGQLGTEPEKVEEVLTEALKRSERWGALMLIDEGDVYLRNRAQNLEQNAVVGVFLRTLEYFNGVLFITTNRGLDIDDAILSRCIAVVQYEKPSEEERVKLWATLSEQFGMKMDSALVKAAAKEFTEVAGRDIKAFLKLAAKWQDVRKAKMSLDLLRKAAIFRGFHSKTKGAA